MWFVFIFIKKVEFSCLFYVWVLYVIIFVVNIGILFGIIGDKFGSERFLGFNVLKGVLCVIFFLLLLLLYNVNDLDCFNECKDLVFKFFY